MGKNHVTLHVTLVKFTKIMNKIKLRTHKHTCYHKCLKVERRKNMINFENGSSSAKRRECGFIQNFKPRYIVIFVKNCRQ